MNQVFLFRASLITFIYQDNIRSLINSPHLSQFSVSQCFSKAGTL